jgi:hypothetical protein
MALDKVYTWTPKTELGHLNVELETIIAFVNAIRDGAAAGGTITGGTAAGENLTLRSTAHATKGKILFGTTAAYDEANARLGVGTQSPTAGKVYVQGDDPVVVRRGTGSQGRNSGVTFTDQAGSPVGAVGTEGVATNDLQILSGTAIRFYAGSNLISTNERVRIDTAGLRLVATDGTGAMTLDEQASSPGNPTSGSQARVYMKADKLVLQYNDAGTVRYKYLDLTGTGVTWVHTTTAP